MISHAQLTALARLVHVVRPDWDLAGVEHALGRVRNDATLDVLAAAALRAAARPENRTPAVIAMAGDHWTPQRTPTAPRPVHGPICGICAQYREICEAHPHADHAFITVEQHAETVRASKGRP